MSFFTGNKGSAFVGTDKVAELKEWNIEMTAETIDASDLDSEWDQKILGAKKASGSILAKYDPDDAAAQASLTVGEEVELNLYPRGNEVGEQYFHIPKAIITSQGHSIKRNELMEKALNFEANGEVKELTVPTP